MKSPRRTWNRRLTTTKDGSPTLEVVEWGVAYHSIHGALTESEHVFIDRGLERWWTDNRGKTDCIRVLEIGFGTGLNAALAWQWAERRGSHSTTSASNRIHSTRRRLTLGLSGLSDDLAWRLRALHEQAGGADGLKADGFSAQILHCTLQAWNGTGAFDVCFFDAFAPTQQPELWEVEIFERLLPGMNPGAVLATYCAKGQCAATWSAPVGRWNGTGTSGQTRNARGVQRAGYPMEHPVLRSDLEPGAHPHPRGARTVPDGSVGCKFPGGGVEQGEAIVDTLWRECAEELGSTEGLTGLGHAYTNDFFVRSAFREDEQILAVYHWMQADHEGIAWWDEKPAAVAASEPLLEMNWEALAELTPDAMRFPIDRHVVANLSEWLAAIQSSPSAD